MLEALAAALEETEVPSDRDGLLEALRLFDRFAVKLSQAVGEFDTEGEWASTAPCPRWPGCATAAG